jgi:hypothetical protein
MYTSVYACTCTDVYSLWIRACGCAGNVLSLCVRLCAVQFGNRSYSHTFVLSQTRKLGANLFERSALCNRVRVRCVHVMCVCWPLSTPTPN